MSNRKRGNESSLELLLDTICNTFGGVLFVAILIVVMLRMTSKTQTAGDVAQVSEAEQLELEQQQAELREAIEMLRRAGAGLDESVEVADSQTAELLETFKAKQRARQGLLHDRLKTLGSIAEHQARTNQTARELEQMEQRGQLLTKKRQDLETTLKAEVASRSQKVEYSSTHQTGKQEIQTVLRYGRFYVWHRHGPSGDRWGLNTDEFVVLDASDAELRTTPMPHAGTIVADTSKALQQLSTRFNQFNPTRDYIGIVVWPDSFEQFRLLKKVLIQRGFEYRLIPAKQGDSFRDRGGSSDGVQ